MTKVGSLPITETAYAKINLALHVRRRREDGYHELETLFAFVDAGDVLSAAPAATDSVATLGEFAGVLDNPFDNLVARATVMMWSTDGSAEWIKPWTWFSAARWDRIGDGL